MKHFLLCVLLSSLVIPPALSQLFFDEIPTGISTQLNSVSNINGQYAWACGVNGTVIKTKNNGYNWLNVTGTGIPPATILINIYAIDTAVALTAGYVGSNTFVYKTTNGGINWVQVFTQANGFINAVWMTSASNGFMQGDPVGGRWSLWKTTNGGVNWDSTGLYLPETSTETSWNNSLWSNRTGTKLWIGTSNTKIYYSSNSGVNWTAQSTAPEINIYSLAVDTVNASLGLAGGSSLLRSTNIGINWSQVTSLGTGDIRGVSPSGGNIYNSHYVRGNSIYYSSAGGMNWGIRFTASAGTYTHMSTVRIGFFTGPGYIYATKTNGGISRGNFIVEGVKALSTEIPEGYKLNQNYPNPFNPTTKIVFSVTKLQSISAGDVRGAFVSLKVYNTLGKEVAFLHDKVIQPGTYEAEWNASNMPTGIYYYSLIVSDPSSGAVVYKESRKMVLIK
jgi:hypothetical protein